MAHLQYMPGDPRLVDQLVYELKSKGIFDQFRKDCIADVDTRPAYQNLRQRVETSVSTFLSRQCWKPDLNKNQLREKLRKHILDGNYLEQGVERIVDQVVNPKVATVFIPQVEDLVYNYLGIPRKKASEPETSEKKPEDLLPTDLEAVSPGSVKSNDDKTDVMEEEDKTEKMEVDQTEQSEVKEETPVTPIVVEVEKKEKEDVQMCEVTAESNDSECLDKSSIPLPAEEIKLENIPAPVNSPPKVTKVELDSIALPQEPNLSTDIPLPDGTPTSDKESYFKPVQLQSEDSSSSSDSSLRRNMSPLTPIRNFNNENSCDAQQGFGDDSDAKSDEKAAPSTFRFTIESKDNKSMDNISDIKEDKKEVEQIDLSCQFNNQVNINTFNTPMYDESSNSNNLHIDYESDVNSKTNIEIKPEIENSQDSKKEKKSEDRKSSHKSSHRSRDSSRHSSSKDKRSDSKHSTSRDSSRHDKKSSSTKDDKSKSSRDRERSKDRSDKKDSRDSSKHRSSHRSSNSKDKDSKSYRSSSSSHRHSSKSLDEKKSSSSSVSKDKEKVSESSKDKSSRDRSRDSKSSSYRSDKCRKGSSSSGKKPEDKDKKKDKKDVDDHYSLSGRGNHSRRSTDRDSNDGSSSSKGSHNQNGSAKTAENKKESKASSSKSDNTSTSGDSPSPSDKQPIIQDDSKMSQCKPVVRVDNHLETPIANPPRLPFVPDVTLKKPRFAANLQEAKKLMKMRKFLDEEQKRMNQEAALLLEFQANVRPSLSQVYSSIPGPELEFACVTNMTAEDPPPYEVTDVKTAETDKTTGTEKSTDMETEDISETVIVIETEDTNSQDNKTNNSESTKLKEVGDSISDRKALAEQTTDPQVLETSENDENNDVSYDENKPFSELMDEITEYSKASEVKTKTDSEEIQDQMNNEESAESSNNTEPEDHSKETATDEEKYFEVTIITEELSESEDIEIDPKRKEVDIANAKTVEEDTEEAPKLPDYELQYFAEHEKYNAELERHEFSNFLKKYMESIASNKKMYLINCDTYEENIFKEMAATFGEFEVVNYYKNGHLKLPNSSKNIVKDVTLSTEISLPVESNEYTERSPLFSPVKSECSFELCSDYDAKLDDINKKSRQEVLEIILGSILDASPSKMPKIDYYTESVIENEMEEPSTDVESEMEKTMSSQSTVGESETDSMKRSIDEVESSVNNNRSVLRPNKIRKMSDSEQISSTTEETEVSNNNKVPYGTRSKYLGRARRVGLPRPKRCHLTNSPSSDKSVENYAQNSPTPPPTNGKMKPTLRSAVQRYDKSDLYKPKLHYLSRRNNVS